MTIKLSYTCIQAEIEGQYCAHQNVWEGQCREGRAGEVEGDGASMFRNGWASGLCFAWSSGECSRGRRHKKQGLQRPICYACSAKIWLLKHALAVAGVDGVTYDDDGMEMEEEAEGLDLDSMSYEVSICLGGIQQVNRRRLAAQRSFNELHP